MFLVILDAPDTVLIERAQGRRVDPKTGGEFQLEANILFTYWINAYALHLKFEKHLFLMSESFHNFTADNGSRAYTYNIPQFNILLIGLNSCNLLVNKVEVNVHAQKFFG